MAFGPTLANRILDYSLRNVAPAAIPAAYLALTSGGTEITGGSYARASLSGKMSAGSGGAITNSGTIAFPTASATWTYDGARIYDAATAGNILFDDTSITAGSVTSGETLGVEVGDLVVNVIESTDPDADIYIAMVIADGGVVPEPAFVDSAVKHAKDNGYWALADFWASPRFGYKLSGSVITKIYNLAGSNHADAGAEPQPTLSTLGSHPSTLWPSGFGVSTDTLNLTTTIVLSSGGRGLVAVVGEPGNNARGAFVGGFTDNQAGLRTISGGTYTARVDGILQDFALPASGITQTSFWRDTAGERVFLGGVESTTGVISITAGEFDIFTVGQGRGAWNHGHISEWLILASGATPTIREAIESRQVAEWL